MTADRARRRFQADDYVVGGTRDNATAKLMMKDLESRLANRVQMTTDAWRSHPDAIFSAFGSDIDFAALTKVYGRDEAGHGRYSPPVVTDVKIEVHCGDPKRHRISTSYVERSDLTMRMGMRRFTRLTNGHSKKFENHKHMQALFFTVYNFCRVHSTLKTTPAIKAGIATEKWTLEDVIDLLDDASLTSTDV